MSDVLYADETFWPPTDRTEAQAVHVSHQLGSWAFGFLGCNVQSFSTRQDRVAVYERTSAHDFWALGPRVTGGFGLWSGLTAGWAPQSLGLVVNTVFDANLDHRVGLSELLDRVERTGVGEPPTPTFHQAVNDIQQWLGFADSHIEAATGISRITLWRQRTGRSGASRSTTDAPVWRLHSLAGALHRALGPDGLLNWLHAGSPSPWDLLRDGHLDEVERAGDRVLFRDPAQRRFAGADETTDDVPLPAKRIALRTRRVHKVARSET